MFLEIFLYDQNYIMEFVKFRSHPKQMKTVPADVLRT